MNYSKSIACCLFGFLFFTTHTIAAEKEVRIVYEKGARIQEITLDGIQSRLTHTKAFILGDDAAFENCDSGSVGAVIAIGKPSLSKAIAACKNTPIVFSLVSAPRLGEIKSHPNVTGISFDLSFRLFLTELQKIMKSGSRIGFIYSSPENEFLATEIDYVESEFNFTGVRLRTENRDELGAKVEQLIEKDKVSALWVLPDPLYNQAIFRKLAELCAEKGVLLVTNFEVLVSEAGAAIALAPSYFDTGVQTAEIVQKILAGTKPIDISYQRPHTSGVYLNLPLFERLKINLPNDLRYKEKVTTLLNEAQDLQKAGQAQQALSKFREVLRYDKKNTTAHYFVNAIESHNNYNTALQRINAGNKMGAIGLLIASSPFLPEARARLQSLRGELRGQVPGIFHRGVAQFQRKKYRDTINTMNLVLMIDPGHHEAQLYKEKAEKRAKAVSAIR
ncbi:MAG TPA: ABC transporter substrate binding protein [Turneriella sp.]|nr:ABC transporter substrate binding protein [Turneriella sp.]